MRAIKELMEEVRFNTGNVDNDRYNDKRLLLYFNAAQRKLQKEIFLANPENDIFSKQYELTLVDGQEMYSLSTLMPDIWAKSSISAAMKVRSTGTGVKPLRKLTYKERTNGTGYFIFGDFIGFMPIPRVGTDTVLISYTAKIADLATRNSISELPAVCEDIMMRLAERLIQYSNSSEEFKKALNLFKEERQELRELFAEVNTDASHPPITSDAYVNY